MQDLTVIGVENGALLAASESGERFRIAIDDVLQSRLRQTTGPRTAGKRVSPREIQGHIRAGLSADEISTLTGASLADIERFEGPVVAERAYVVNSALKVAVQAENANDPLHEEPKTTFGAAIEDRLEKLSATESRWASWKDESGWIVKLSFTAGQIDHDARWQFDPKRHTLAPLNNEAITLSQHGTDLSQGLIPRLRAVSNAPAPTAGDDDAADTLTFEPSAPRDSIPFVRNSYQESSPAATAAAISRAEETPADANNQTADLLEALRRGRGERENVFVDDYASAAENPTGETPAGTVPAGTADTGEASPPDAVEESKADRFARQPAPTRTGVPAVLTPFTSAARGGIPATGDTAALRPTKTSPAWATSAPDATLPGLEATAQPAPVSDVPPAKAPKRTRSAMPSWDEIVFGARTDDDLA